MSRKRNLNAKDALPDDLFRAVSDSLNGKSAHLWVPSAATINMDERNNYIKSLHDDGSTIAEIASVVYLSERQVTKILVKQRLKR